jgi:hypothetical protein
MLQNKCICAETQEVRRALIQEPNNVVYFRGAQGKGEHLLGPLPHQASVLGAFPRATKKHTTPRSSVIFKTNSLYIINSPRMMYQGGLRIHIQLCCRKTRSEEFPGISNILPHSFSKTLEQKSFIFLFPSGASATQNPIVPDSSLINHQDFPLKAGIVVAWQADKLQFHDQLTLPQHVALCSQTELSFHYRNKWSKCEISMFYF